MNKPTASSQIDQWYANSGYEDFKPFVQPDVTATVEECAADVLASIGRLERGELPVMDTSSL